MVNNSYMAMFDFIKVNKTDMCIYIKIKNIINV